MIVPSDEISRLSSTVKALFLRWTDFMYSRVRFNMPDSELHATAHCERVLLFGLLIGEKQFPDNSTAWEILAHASVFHDTRRFDEYLDTGHGSRAADYYRDFCGNTTDICYHPEAEYLMRSHDRDDNIGKTAIENAFGDDSTSVLQLYDYSRMLMRLTVGGWEATGLMCVIFEPTMLVICWILLRELWKKPFPKN